MNSGASTSGSGSGEGSVSGGGSGSNTPIAAIRGALTFLTRLPVPGSGLADWDAFRRAPWTFPVVGVVVGLIAGVAFLFALPTPTTVAVYLVALYLLTGVTHADGLADLGDAVAAHDPERRQAALKDSAIGVGGVLALLLTFVVLALGAFTLPALDVGSGSRLGVAFRIAVAAEVGAKLGMATLVCLGTSAHEGLGSQLINEVGGRALVPTAILGLLLVGALAVPIWGATDPVGGPLIALVATVLAGPAVALLLLVSTRDWLGGVSGDVIGAANELGRAIGIHVGVVVWILT